MNDSFVARFLFTHLGIRGAIVRLGAAWQSMQADRHYPEPVAGLLGELAAVTTLIGEQLKHPGRLTLQLRGDGPISLLVMDCNEQLQIRGMARAPEDVAPAPVPVLLGVDQGGQLMMSLDLPTAQRPYQSMVPLVGDSISDIFSHYLAQSEQQDAYLFSTANTEVAACFFLQKLPDSEQQDADAWARLRHLALTLKAEELRTLEPATLLTRLFHEEMGEDGLELYAAQPVVHHCPEDWDKVRAMVRSLGESEARSILAEHGEIHLRDDICNRDYRFSKADIDLLFLENATQVTH